MFYTDLGIAPYAVNVNMRLRAGGSMGGFNAANPPDGRTYYQIVLDMYGAEINSKMDFVIKYYFRSVNMFRPFVFVNPFKFGRPA